MKRRCNSSVGIWILAGQLGVGFELQFLRFMVVVGFSLLEGSLAVLADHDERLQQDRFE
jgi:hypothetical protein